MSQARNWPIPAWLPLYWALVLGVTLTPLWMSCVRTPFHLHASPQDFALNTVLFLPLGWALARLPALGILVLAGSFSVGVELVQVHLPRSPAAMDVVANATGAWIGQAARRLCPPRPRLHPPSRNAVRVALLCLAPLALVLFVLGAGRLRANDFSNWEPYDLVIGNELTLDRPWEGEIRELAVFDRVLARDPAPAGRRGPPSWREGGPVLWMRFEPPTQATLDGPEGARPLPDPLSGRIVSEQGLVLRDDAIVLPRWAADVLRRRLMETSRLTITARLKAGRRDATGPARIVSMSRDVYLRDFTLGQFDANLELRVRTPNTSAGAHFLTARGSGEVLDGRLQTVRASFHGSYGRIFVDGHCTGDELYPLTYAPWPLGRGIALSILVTCVLAALAGGSWAGRGSGGGAPAGVLGGAAVWAVMWSAGAWAHMPRYDATAALIGAIAVAVALPLLHGLGRPSRPPVL